MRCADSWQMCNNFNSWHIGMHAAIYDFMMNTNEHLAIGREIRQHLEALRVALRTAKWADGSMLRLTNDIDLTVAALHRHMGYSK